MSDQNRKTLRSFYCRDYLWDLFEQMTQELGCSMDYLINESMRAYARNRDYAHGDSAGVGQMAPQDAMGAAPVQGGAPQLGGEWNRQGGMEHRTFQRMPAVPGGQPQFGQQGARPQQQFGQPGGGARQQFAQPQQAPPRGPGGPPPPPRRGAGRQPFGGAQPGPSVGFGQQQPAPQNFGQPQRGPLYLIFNNNRYLVDNDKFIIGRGSQQTDLTIRDGNISRQHCAVIHRNGNYYIKDLGSTNGVEYRGNRIESKRIEEGDAFFLCDYELRFTYQG